MHIPCFLRIFPMKKIIIPHLILLSILCTALSAADKTDKSKYIYATTEDGRLIKVYPDGKWESETKKISAVEIDESKLEKFQIPEGAVSIKKSENYKYSIYYKPEDWKILNYQINELSDTTMVSTNHECYAIVIAERTSVSLETLKEAVLINAKKASSDIQTIKSEYRIVNGKKMLFLVLFGTVMDAPIKYYYYLYSGVDGAFQVIAFATGINFVNNEKKIEEILNGFAVNTN